jgi:hypothetical protein
MHSSKKRRGTEGKLATDVPQPAGSGLGRCRLCLEATDTQKSPSLLAQLKGVCLAVESGEPPGGSTLISLQQECQSSMMPWSSASPADLD